MFGGAAEHEGVVVRRVDAAQAFMRVTGQDAAGSGALARDGAIQLWPHVHTTDAMFIAVLRRMS
jgi:16S rRNA C967 or C1407 C5-methylase (RsmB/RsmF family)